MAELIVDLPKPTPPRRDPYSDPITMAVVDLVAERGYSAVSEHDIVERAGVSEEEFRRRYADKEECVLDAFEVFAEEHMWRLESAYQSQPDWRSGLRAAAYESADWLAEYPNVWRFGAVGLLEAKSEMIRVRREEALSYGGKLIDRGRFEEPDPSAVPESAALMAVGSLAQMLTHRLQRDGSADPTDEIPELMYVIVRQYLGEATARAELEEPRPPSWRNRGVQPGS